MEEYDVIIAGGSFAGLSVANSIKGNVLIIDPKEIGSHQTSACGMPYSTVKELDCEKSVLQIFDTIKFHTSRIEKTVKIKELYCTIDYKKFCQELAKKCGSKIIRASAKCVRGNEIITSEGSFYSRVIVDCSGWQAVLASSIKKDYFNKKMLSFGIETVVDYSDDSMHFFIDPQIIEKGGAWIFPIGNKSRFGLGSFIGKTNLMPELVKFLKRYDLEPKEIHGGFIPCGLKSGVVENIFVVGDSASQALPLTGEGIRKAIYFGRYCGKIIQKILNVEISLENGLNEYQNFVMMNKKGYDILVKAQNLLINSPQGFVSLVMSIVFSKMLASYFEQKYLKI